MPSPCSVCQRSDSAVINAALSHGEAIRALSRRFAIPKTSMLRHARHVQPLHPEESPRMETRRVTERPEEPVAAVLARMDQLVAMLGALQATVAKLDARVAMQARAIQAVEAQGQALALTVRSHEVVVMTLGEFVDLLGTNDDAWRTMDSLLQMGSTSTRGTLHTAVAEKVGRPRPMQYIRQ
jgi:hypothetical protein